jgi:hypothetical protein
MKKKTSIVLISAIWIWRALLDNLSIFHGRFGDVDSLDPGRTFYKTAVCININPTLTVAITTVSPKKLLFSTWFPLGKKYFCVLGNGAKYAPFVRYVFFEVFQ